MRTICFSTAVLVSIFTHNAIAKDVSIGVDAGLIGLGVNVGYDHDDRFGVRYSSTSLSVDEIDIEESSNLYEGELDWSFNRLAGIWHPFRGAFYLTAGIAKNKSSITGGLVEEGLGTVSVGSNTYSLNNVGELNVKANFPTSNTYLGLGWRGGHADKAFVTRFEIGIAKGKAPDVTISEVGSNVIAQADLDAEALVIEDGLKDASTFPFIMFGIEYHFDLKDFKLPKMGSKKVPDEG